jgi:membrane protease YdiL (CAAX protease family)
MTQPRTRASKLSALLEVVGLFVLGPSLAGHIWEWRGRSLGTVLGSALGSTPPDWVAASAGWLETMGIYHACLLLPALALGWWRRRAGPHDYGLTLAGEPASRLVGIGVLGFALVGLGFLLLGLARNAFSLGPHPGLLGAYVDQPWPPGFWLFLAVASVGFQPFMEDVFFRGYAQTRLEEAYGGVGAVVIVSALLALGHNQYHQLTLMSVGTILAMLLFNIGLGFLYLKYRSLLPVTVLHGLANMPSKGLYQWLQLGVMLLVLVLFRREWLGAAAELLDALRAKGWKTACLAASGAATVAAVAGTMWPDVLVPLMGVGLVVAVVIAAREPRPFSARRHAAQPQRR